MNKLLSYLNQIILTIRESDRRACVVIIGEPIPIMMQSLIDETWHIHWVRVYQYDDEYHADYLWMSKLFKVAYVIKDDHSIFVYDFDRIWEWMNKLRSLNWSKKFWWLSPTKIFIDDPI